MSSKNSAPTARWGPYKSLLVLAPLLIGAPVFTVYKHYALPSPISELINPHTNLPQLSEAQILSYSKLLSEDIGYRTVGTIEHALADEWLTNKAHEIKKECEEIVNRSRGTGEGRKLECEVWRQQGTGSHRFDMMGKRLYKTYVDLTNIIIRVSNGTPEGKEHAVLVNSHLDSTLPSPGAADDALSVGVMLECIRVLTNTPTWEPAHSIIFLFNHAEESLQDASQLFSTQHPIRDSVRAFINLEAAGTVGPELLFQATSEQMIEAYSRVPRPFGTVVANEVFSSGVILSDTDFRQFELYLNVTGLDMAVVGNSYMYHTRKDLVENIQPGVAQHMAENVHALLLYLSSSESPLPSLDFGYTRPSTVFFSHLGFFFKYSYATARVLYSVFLIASLVLIAFTWQNPAPALKSSGGRGGWIKDNIKAAGAAAFAFVGALVGVNLLAAVMQYVLGRSMSWYAVELSALALYGPAALAGAFTTQLLVARLPERTMFSGLLLSLAFSTISLQLIGIGSAAMFFLSAVPIFLSILLDSLFTGGKGPMSLWAYALGQILPLTTGTQVVCTVFDVFVPLTGRIGREAPAEHIIASLVGITGSYALPLVLPFSHRYGARFLKRFVVILSAITLVMVAVFAAREPFDELHQKRLFVLSSENITSGERHMHIGATDGAPGLENLVEGIIAEFGAAGSSAVQEKMDDWNGDWDVLYPFSAFMSPYKVELPPIHDYASPYVAGGSMPFVIEAINDVIDEDKQTRSLTLRVNHPGVIWTVIAFDAHVLRWTLDDSPPDEYARHHIKEGSFYGIDTWTVDLLIRIPPPGIVASSVDSNKTPTAKERAQLKVNFVGVQETAMWPGKSHRTPSTASSSGSETSSDKLVIELQKKRDKAVVPYGPAMKLFEKLDGWLEERTDGKVDGMFVGCVGGVVVI